MNQNGVGRLRREYARLRWTLPVWWTATILVVLAAGSLMPRAWVADFVLRFDGVHASAIADSEQRLGELRDASPGTALHFSQQGVDLRVELSATEKPQQLGPALLRLLDTFVRDRQQALSQAQQETAERLRAALERAETERGAVRAELDEALAAMPAGGDAAAAARLGRMQAEAQSLGLAIRDGKARQAELQARIEELDAAIAALPQASPAGDEEAARQDADGQGAEPAALLARRESAREDLLHLERTNAAAARRSAELARLIDANRSELLRLQAENAQILQLNEKLETATQMLQSAQQQLDAHQANAARTMALGFTVASVQPEPRIAHGLDTLHMVGLAVAAACIVVLLRLLAASTIRPETRNLVLLADRLHVRALAELPTWRDAARDPVAALRRVASMLVGLVGAAACVFYAVLA